MLKVHKLEDENKALKKQLGMPNGESLTASSDDNVFTAKVTNVWAGTVTTWCRHAYSVVAPDKLVIPSHLQLH